jgi:hypothetical protein
MTTSQSTEELFTEPNKLFWTLSDDLDNFELDKTDAYPQLWRDREALYLDQEEMKRL